jgi:hypothetical protein
LALDPTLDQWLSFARCVGARRFTFNHYLGRVMQNLDVLAGQREAKLAAPDMIPGLSWSKFSFINEFNACNNDLARFVRITRPGSVWSAKRGGAKTMWPWSTSGWILPVWPDCLRPKGGVGRWEYDDR